MKETEFKKILGKIEQLSEVFDRWMQGKATEAERKVIDHWDPEGQMNDRPDRNESERARLHRYEKVTRRVFLKVGFNEQTIRDQIQSELQRSRLREQKAGYAIRRVMVAAACALVIFTVGSLFFYHQERNLTWFFVQVPVPDSNFTVPFGEIRGVYLTDGTKVTLNGGSKLSYATNRFNKRQRDIWLEGEAFFEVAKNPRKPFVVHTTGNMQTIVRGTSFNVKAYPQLDENLVSVSTGKVEIHSGAKLLDTLTANEQLAYHISTEAYSKTRSNPEDAIAWISKRLVLKNAGAKELAIRLKQLYGMELSVEGDILRDKKFGASFTAGATFEEVIQGICRLYDLNYKIIAANQVVIYE